MTCNAVTLNRVLLFVHPFIYCSAFIQSLIVVLEIQTRALCMPSVFSNFKMSQLSDLQESRSCTLPGWHNRVDPAGRGVDEPALKL